MEAKVDTFVVDVRGELEAWPTLTPTPTVTPTPTPTVTVTPTPRFVDNGDGTIIDNQTGLQWEKKVAGSGCLHCVDDMYNWSIYGSPYPDGAAFTGFLATLNGGATGVGNCVDDGTSPPTGVSGGFAGHCDWRLPTIVELQTIMDLTKGFCGGSWPGDPCIDPIFGPTRADLYWSSTSVAIAPSLAWHVHFNFGRARYDDKWHGFWVRAVRGGS